MADNVVATVMGNPVTLAQTIQGSSSNNWWDSVTSSITGIFDTISSGIQGVYQVKQALKTPVTSTLSNPQLVQAVQPSSIIPQWIAPSSTATAGQKTMATILWILVISAAGFFVLTKLRHAR